MDSAQQAQAGELALFLLGDLLLDDGPPTVRAADGAYVVWQPHAVTLRTGHQANQGEMIVAPAVPLPSLGILSLWNSHCVRVSFLRWLIFGVVQLPQDG